MVTSRTTIPTRRQCFVLRSFPSAPVSRSRRNDGEHCIRADGRLCARLSVAKRRVRVPTKGAARMQSPRRRGQRPMLITQLGADARRNLLGRSLLCEERDDGPE